MYPRRSKSEEIDFTIGSWGEPAITVPALSLIPNQSPYPTSQHTDYFLPGTIPSPPRLSPLSIQRLISKI